MNDRTVRCVYVPSGGAPREEILSVTGDHFAAKLGGETVYRPLPDGDVVVSRMGITLESDGRKFAGYRIHGDFIISKRDAMGDLVSLPDGKAEFYTLLINQVERDALPGDREVWLADVTVTYRKVKIPSTCTCGADLTREESIDVWSYHDEATRARLPRYAGDVGAGADYEELGAVMSSMSDCSRAGELVVKAVAYLCVACSTILAEGKEDVREP